jgi:uncharacterized protein
MAAAKLPSRAAVLFFAAALNGHAQTLDDNLRSAGFTELHGAVWSGDADKVRRLVAAGANVNVASDSGTTPLHSAAMKDSVAVIRTLLELGAALEARDSLGRTPLFVAAEVNREPTKVIEQLLSAGASTEARDKFGKTARDACWTAEACRLLGGTRKSADPTAGSRRSAGGALPHPW